MTQKYMKVDISLLRFKASSHLGCLLFHSQ